MQSDQLNTKLYAGIYDTVAENLRNAGMEMSYLRTTFLSDVGTQPEMVSVARLMPLPNEDFAQAAYVAVMQRLPDEKTAAFWAGKYDMSQPEFQEEMLRSLAHSSVVAINHIRLTENPYFEQQNGLRSHLLGMLYGLTDKSNLREFGKKLPMPVQRLIRKVFL